MASKTQPKPNATIPPKARVIHVFFFNFMKRNCRSIKGENAKNAKAVADILAVFTTKAESMGVVLDAI